MQIQVGQEIEHTQFGKGVVTAVLDETKIKATFEEEEFEKIVHLKFLNGFVPVAASLRKLNPSLLSPDFLAYLNEHREEVNIRIHYPKHAEPFVLELFSRIGVDLPDDIRPIDSGRRGGITVQRTLAGEMWFPAPPAGVSIPNPHHMTNGVIEISTIGLILAVLQAGFSVTKYVHTEE